MGGRGSGSGLKGDDPTFDWLGQANRSKGDKIKPIDIKKYQGQSLQQIEGRIRNLAHEELFAIDREGKIIAAYKGGATSVAIPRNLLKEEGITVTHGHPKGYQEYGGTFSFADVSNMLNSKWQEHRATASGQGEMNYIMRRTENSDPEGLRNRINRDYPDLKRQEREAYKETYLREKEARGKKQASHAARQAQVGVLNAYYKETFPQYGYEYIVRKTDYQYNR